MRSTVHVVARFRAKEGKEEALKAVLVALIAPTRREINCMQCDMLENLSDPRDFCFVERWEHDKGLDRHGETEHMQKARAAAADLLDEPPDIRRFRQV